MATVWKSKTFEDLSRAIIIWKGASWKLYSNPLGYSSSSNFLRTPTISVNLSTWLNKKKERSVCKTGVVLHDFRLSLKSLSVCVSIDISTHSRPMAANKTFVWIDQTWQTVIWLFSKTEQRTSLFVQKCYQIIFGHNHSFVYLSSKCKFVPIDSQRSKIVLFD